MNSQLLAVVQHIENERGVSREIVITAIEQAIQQAARKNRDVTNDLRVSIDRRDLSLHVYDTLVASDEETGPGFISIARAVRFNHGNPVAEGDTIEVGTAVFTVIETPGHTPGGICLLGSGTAEGILFTGDTLFAGSRGRTDLAGGDEDAIMDSLERLKREIPSETAVLCGHGPSSTMGREIRSNPFLR